DSEVLAFPVAAGDLVVGPFEEGEVWEARLRLRSVIDREHVVKGVEQGDLCRSVGVLPCLPCGMNSLHRCEVVVERSLETTALPRVQCHCLPRPLLHAPLGMLSEGVATLLRNTRLATNLTKRALHNRGCRAGWRVGPV